MGEKSALLFSTDSELSFGSSHDQDESVASRVCFNFHCQLEIDYSKGHLGFHAEALAIDTS